MQKQFKLTAIINAEEDMFVALCPELDVVSQGYSVEEARTNLIEAVELFLEHAGEVEIAAKLHGETQISSFEVIKS